MPLLRRDAVEDEIAASDEGSGDETDHTASDRDLPELPLNDTGEEDAKIAETAARAEQGNILIAVTPSDQIWMNKNPVELQSVRILMEAAHAENPESSVVIVADELASTGAIIDVMDGTG